MNLIEVPFVYSQMLRSELAKRISVYCSLCVRKINMAIITL